MAIELKKNGYIKGLTAGLSASIKYHSILFAGPYWGFLWLETLFQRKKLNFKDSNFISGLFCVSIFLLFLIGYLYLYDIWIIPEKWKDDLVLKGSTFLDNFFSYGFYLSALFFVTIPYFVINTKFKSHLIALIISLPLALINQDNGEMNFGSLDQILGSEFILLIKIIGFWNFLLCIEIFLRNKKSRVMALTVLFYMLLLSASRPAQRYLLFVIPFWALLIVQSNIKLHALFKWGYLSCLLMMAIFSSVYQVANAKASKDIISWSEKENLLINTNHIYPHVGDSLMHSWESDLSVELEAQEGQDVIFISPVSVFGYEIRRYLVVKNKDT
jgi:hypothetical protein